MKEIVYKSGKSVRLDSFLQESFPLLKTGIVNKFLRQNKIKINGVKKDANFKLRQNDKITLYVEDSFLETPTKETAFQFSGKNLEVVFEDPSFIIVNKPSGIVVIDENWKNFDTLINRVINYYHIQNKTLDFIPALCHRIDTGTQGLVVLAKNQTALDFMQELFKEKQVEKTYICVTKGMPKKRDSIEKAYLVKNAKEGYVTVSAMKKGDTSKPIETRVKVLSSYGEYSLLEINLITGRTHQIRAHLAYLQLPILGDSRYGDNNLNRALKLKYQLLCSNKIKFLEIENRNFKYLSNMQFTCTDPWFLESFNKREF